MHLPFIDLGSADYVLMCAANIFKHDALNEDAWWAARTLVHARYVYGVWPSDAARAMHQRTLLR